MTKKTNPYFADAGKHLVEVQKMLSQCAALVSAAEIELSSNRPKDAYINIAMAKDKLRGVDSILGLGGALTLHGLNEAAKQ